MFALALSRGNPSASAAKFWISWPHPGQGFGIKPLEHLIQHSPDQTVDYSITIELALQNSKFQIYHIERESYIHGVLNLDKIKNKLRDESNESNYAIIRH